MKKIITIMLCLLSLTSIVADPVFGNTILTAQQIYEKAEKSIYEITSGTQTGGAVAITEDTLVTNCHVLSHRRAIWINHEIRIMQIINTDYKDIDLCFLYVPDMQLKPVKIRASSDVKIGESVYAIGNPQGYNKTISRGIVSNKIERKNGPFIQTDAAISHGSSGGGLFDDKGNLIGITSLMDTRGNGIAFAAPTDPIIKILTKISAVSRSKFMANSKDFNIMVSIVKRYSEDLENSKLIEELKRCSKMGSDHCSATLAEMYYEKGWYSEAYPLLIKTSGLSGSNSDYALGIMFLNGLGVDKEYSKAWEYFGKAVLLGDAEAAREFGYVYLNQVLSKEKGVEAQEQDPDYLMKGYAFIKVAKALGAETYKYDGMEGPISELIEVMEPMLDRYDSQLSKQADGTAEALCHDIERCVIVGSGSVQ